MTDSTSVRAAQVIGIAGSAFVSGAILSISFVSVPALVAPLPDSKVQYSYIAVQWRRLYELGKSLIPPIATTAATAYTYAAYQMHPFPGCGWYATAGMLTFGIVPFTLGLMKKTNDKLHDKAGVVDDIGLEGAEEAEQLRTEKTEELVTRWKRLNAQRGLLPLAGAIIGAVITTIYA
ncbi:DUF1772-domain-containing protein [Guyanagaster necrorhizus]|uniref:DUF1772-domain-containing protein n=1 Tax=Guyanagaster necrorhizus TaxID=856835 RepID=A0A9P8AQJ2_9AGAR|nr:DUF1772-domain-containing protein [Guyanagaster necrorhizus MCA 3950]KAG7442927.1 DUF1772-domain-containing protein [Guyanagaster necrorhizus MCA 3950]